MATPYDGKIHFWHHIGERVGEATIDELAQNLKKYCPTADGIWVKTSDGKTWMGNFDTKDSMSIDDPQDIARWVTALSAYGLEFHAWAVPVGDDIPGEIARIVEACKVPGVKSMILDVEPHEGFWRGTREAAIQLMSGIRQQVGNSFHIGLSVDPRRNQYDRIFPDAWRPYVNSLHPQVYWELMRRDPDDVLDETFVVWGNYGLPIYPAFEGYANPDSLRAAQDLARGVRGVTGISYFRLGVISPMQYAAINEEVVDEQLGPDAVIRTYGWEKIVSPDDPGYRDGTHIGQPSSQVFKSFTSVRGHNIKYKPTQADRDQVYAEWRPGLPVQGLYEVSVYIPSRHASSTHAQYHIHGIVGRGTELLVRLNQSGYSNQWVPLVVYEFQTGSDGGRVNLSDLTGEADREIAFTAVRWRQVLEQKKAEIPEIKAGFDPPIGTAEERLTAKVWPGDWYDATGFAKFYTTVGSAYHTGADLNLPRDLDRNAPVVAAADGTVTFAGRSSGTWGRLIIIRHDPLPDGTQVWSRTAHIRNPIVKEGDRVERGQQIASVGDADGQLAWHLHFDIGKTNILELQPGHWPGANLDQVLKHYIDPRQFIADHRPPGRA